MPSAGLAMLLIGPLLLLASLGSSKSSPAQDQTIVEIGDEDGSRLLLIQPAGTNDLQFTLFEGDESYSLTVVDGLTPGEMQDLRAGIDPDGRMWVELDGSLSAEGPATVPTNLNLGNVTFGGFLEGGAWQEFVEDLSVAEVIANDEPSLPDVTDPPGDVTPPDDPTPPEDPAPPEDPPPPSGDMFIVAHQDDDLLFMNPTLSEAIAGDEPVTTVYVTAGDAGEDEAYWAGREEGIKAAYSVMAGADDWVDELASIEVGGESFDVASSYLGSDPDIRLYFLRLPDGFSAGQGSEAYGNESLQQLAEGGIDTITTVDDTESYSAEQLTGVLTAIMEMHAPDQIHLQDHTTEHADIEHSDHIQTAEFASEAILDYSGEVTVTGYLGYATWGFEENLTPEEVADVRAAFMAYAAHDSHVLNADGSLQEAYETWVQREYPAYEYDHGAALMDMLALPADVSGPVDPDPAEDDPALSDPVVI